MRILIVQHLERVALAKGRAVLADAPWTTGARFAAARGTQAAAVAAADAAFMELRRTYFNFPSV